MKTIFTFIFCLATMCSAMAQQTDLPAPKTRKASKRHNDYNLKYTVLQKTPSVKHGPYRMEGKFWYCEGAYNMDNRAGIWSFYGWNGKLDYQFDFTKNQEVYSDRKSDSLDQKVQVYLNGQYVRMDVDSRAFYLGGDARIMSFLGKHIRYPAEAQRAEAEGTTIIAVEIDEDGKLIQRKVVKELGFGFDEEALRIIDQLPHEWIPAMVNGKPVRSKSYIPVRFAIK